MKHLPSDCATVTLVMAILHNFQRTAQSKGDSLGSARVRTIARQQIAGQVRLNVTSRPITVNVYGGQIGVIGGGAQVEGGINFDTDG